MVLAPDNRDAHEARVYRVDHHRPGDPGYGKQPAQFLAASSIGQVISILARLGSLPNDWMRRDGGMWNPRPRELGRIEDRWCGDTFVVWQVAERQRPDLGISDCRWVDVPTEIVYAAAADHCLGAAYQGKCFGVDPDALMRWRVETRARLQERPIAEVLADVERARAAVRAALIVRLDGDARARDLRGRHVPELPEAAVRESECCLATVTDPDGRTKVVCQAGTPEEVRAFMFRWAPAHGLIDIYGDPARGIAGGYVAPREPGVSPADPRVRARAFSDDMRVARAAEALKRGSSESVDEGARLVAVRPTPHH